MLTLQELPADVPVLWTIRGDGFLLRRMASSVVDPCFREAEVWEGLASTRIWKGLSSTGPPYPTQLLLRAYSKMHPQLYKVPLDQVASVDRRRASAKGFHHSLLVMLDWLHEQAWARIRRRGAEAMRI